ncbi:LysR family transcriptional regulator [Candidatus Enterococcus ferrettii]|uniref:HTH lysR-type domain-containing protein n=1 Tax=Candidatus Enterococcus ferrettii TaxID=2815324 RepID=A0ABV0ET95_9ENTE|nr:LysR family transcriptional regulator [Enterococcus sp. 665A]MBO1339308.1 LysR family transcriptional regulator [Enterococcus sp. 665A]
MKLSTLHYFVEVAAEGSFTKAAQKLYISQPTLSRRIQELETELGVALFVRHSHALALSDAGEQFLVEANDVLDRVDRLSHMFDHQQTAEKATQLLKIGCLANFNMNKMYELFSRFKIDHPNVTFLIKQDTPMNLSDGLAKGQYELVFDLSTYFQHSENVEQLIFMRNHLQVAVPLHHTLSKKKKVSFSDLNQETFILLERKQSPIIVDYVVNQFVNYGFNVRANSYVKNLEEGLTKVALGEGLAFLYSGMNDGTLEEKYPIKIIDLASDGSDQNIVAAYDKRNDNSLLKELFLFLKNNLKG